jgi:flagellar biosynthetic protein FliQ
MTPEMATDIVRLAIFITAEISAPMLITTLFIGLGVSIFQSVTQITETTLIFIPKFVCIGLTFALTFPWILKVLMKFFYEIIFHHWNEIMSHVNLAM